MEFRNVLPFPKRDDHPAVTREQQRDWIARNWDDVERVLRRKGDSDEKIAALKRDVVGA